MLATLFPGDHRPSVLRVGSSFAIAAAAGGLAHILHNYDPPRLRASDSDGKNIFQPSLESTLPYPVLLGIKQSSDPEQKVTVLDPNDPFIDDGGRRAIEDAPALAKGSQPKMRLVPGGSAGVAARQGRRFQALRVLQSPGKMEIDWDPSRQRAIVYSDQIEGTKGSLWIDVNTLRKRQESSSDPFDDPLRPGALAVDAADDVVLDVGMSKIVALTADRGWVSAEELERAVRDGLSKPQLIEEPPSVPARTVEELETEPKAESLTASEYAPRAAMSRDAADDTLPGPGADVASPGARRDARLSEAQAQAPKRTQSAASPSPHVPRLTKPEDSKRFDWGSRVSDAEFSYALEALRDAVKAAELNLAFDDIVVALLALAVRPIVLLAGPPGCGKSTLVRTVAHILGKELGQTFHEVAVQAHWENDSALFGDGGLLSPLLENTHAHLILFDEFNLTRPEYYLSRLFHALDGGNGALTKEMMLAPCRVFGTMNIDDSSRPPSPKVIDRCFLLELTQVSWEAESPADLSSLGPLPDPARLARCVGRRRKHRRTCGRGVKGAARRSHGS